MEEFDYVIVGAGSAGCVLARRLAEAGAVRILVLEAGPRDTNPWIHVPIGYYRTIYDPRIGWGYETEPEPHLRDRRIRWPRGKVLGGCSSVNGLIYVRGQREDFDAWRDMGADGWGWDDVAPYFLKAEDQQRGAGPHHGVGGPLGVSDMAVKTELADAFVRAAAETGIPLNDDFNGPEQEGVGYFQLTTRRGRRSSSAVAYLRPVADRPNVEIRCEAHATRIIVERRRAVGVEYRWRGGVVRARVREEVLLCGGAINSPQLLQLSGIGPADHLRASGIPVLMDLPGVGANLQDHLQVRTVQATRRPVTFNDFARSIPRKVAAGLQYLVSRGGPLTLGAGQVGAFARTRPEIARPDVQFHFIPFSASRPGAGLHPFSAFTLSVCQLRPNSRGTVLVRGPDPFSAPLIRANYLSDPEDLETVLAGVRLGRRICGSKAMAEMVSREVEPGEAVDTEDALEDYVRRTAVTIFHPCGTCRIGPPADPGAVVDAALRVRGIAGLRVVDASVMPTIVSGNTNAAAIMIGERGADLILRDGPSAPAEGATRVRAARVPVRAD
jgi:choline dehydrogenase